jgi:hypothetical protein
MQPITRQVHLLCGFDRIEALQDTLHLIHHVRPNLRAVAALEQSLQATMSKASDYTVM